MRVELQKQADVGDFNLILLSCCSEILNLRLNLFSELAYLILEKCNILSNFLKLTLELFLHLIFLAHHLLMKLI